MRLSKIVLASTALLTGYGTAQAQYRCDCTTVVDTCSAEITARGTFLEIKTDSQQCARVDYFVDGQPFVSMVVDGDQVLAAFREVEDQLSALKLLAEQSEAQGRAVASARRSSVRSFM